VRKDFEEIYNEIYEECIMDLKQVKKRINLSVGIVLLILIVLNLLILIFVSEKSLLTISISVSVLFSILTFSTGRKKYSKKYKNCVINGLIKKYNKNLEFDPQNGVSSYDYRISNFDTTFDEYYSEDRIYGQLENGAYINASEITTYIVNEYVDGYGESKTDKTQTFRGYYGAVKLEKNPSIEITILGDNFTRKYSKKRLEVDSSEFEKYYDCITDDRVKAMEIFTSDLIEKYVDIMKVNKYLFEVKINNNMLYFRYKCGNVFEAPAVGIGLNKELIRKNYKLFFYPLEVIEETVNHIYSYVDTK